LSGQANLTIRSIVEMLMALDYRLEIGGLPFEEIKRSSNFDISDKIIAGNQQRPEIKKVASSNTASTIQYIPVLTSGRAA
jgi:hypothetical protein